MTNYARVAMLMMVALAVGAVDAARAAGAAPAAKYATPVAVVAAYEKAHDAGDDAAGIDCMSPEGQAKSLKFMIGMEIATRQPDVGGPAPTAEEKAAQEKAGAAVDALLAKHGIKDLSTHPGEEAEAYLNRITANVTDPRGLLIESVKLIQEAAKRPPCRKGELKDLKITGDTATAKYVTKESGDSTMSQDVKFKQVDGSWLLADLLMLSSTETSDPPDAANHTATQPAKP